MAPEPKPRRFFAVQEEARHPWLVLAAPLIAAGLILAMGISYFSQRANLNVQERRLHGTELALAFSRQIEQQIEHLAAANAALTASLRAPKDALQADASIMRMQQVWSGVSTLRVVENRLNADGARPNSAPIKFAVGTAGNLSAAGPQELILSGPLLIVSQPIHVSHNAHDSLLWGHVQAATEVAQLRQVATQMLGNEFEHRLSHFSRRSGQTHVLSGADQPVDDAIIRTLTLSNGDLLSAELRPRHGWHVDAFYVAELALVFAAALLLGIFLYLLLQRHALRIPHRNDEPVFFPERAATGTPPSLNRADTLTLGVHTAIVRQREPAALLEATCQALVDQGGFPLGWFEPDDRSGSRADAPGNSESFARSQSADLLPISTKLLRECQSACPTVKPIASPECVHLCRPGDCRHGLLQQEMLDRGLTGIAWVSLAWQGKVFGTLAVGSRASPPFEPAELDALHALAEDLSQALTRLSLVDQRRQTENKLKLAAQVFENSSEGIMITDAANLILMVNKAFTQVTGYESAEVIGQNPRILSSGKQDPGFYREMWASIQKRGEWHGEVQNRRRNGAFYSEWLTISAVRNERGEITNFVAVFSDITSAKQVEERLNFLANYDTLTGLPNRVLFTDRLEHALAASQTGRTSVAVLLLDLDRFSLINETCGHTVGDAVLREVSVRLAAAARSGDSVSRMGGDEFALVLPGLSSADEASKLASKLMQSLVPPLCIDQQEIYTSASIGISIFPDDGRDVGTLVRNANSALIRAMEEGRNTFRFYHPEMNARSSERMSLEVELRHALERGELVMHYQPFIDSQSGQIVGAEALLRWHRPNIGFVSPEAFVPMLEDTGLIVPIGEWILKTACMDNQRWRQHGFQDMFVAVNFSAIQLGDEAIARKVDATLAAIGFDPRHLEIELTESVVMRDAERGLRTLAAFREIGTRLSIDDFGTGYSSLAYLKRLPIDTIKIDRSFISGTPSEHEANAIVQAIVSMAHSLRLKIIAEGVQAADQVSFLKQIRCDLLQGFYFSPALDQVAFLELLRSRSKPWLHKGGPVIH